MQTIRVPSIDGLRLSPSCPLSSAAADPPRRGLLFHRSIRQSAVRVRASVEAVAAAPRRETDPRKRVVITGMGLVSVFGNDVDVYYEKLLEGESGIGPIDRFDASRLPTRFAGQIRGFSSEGYIDGKNDRRLDDCLRYCLVSGKKALESAGLGVRSKALGKRATTRKLTPFCIPYAITNMGSAMLAMDTGFMGANYSISTACATSNYCFYAVANHIRRDEADLMIADGTEAPIIPLGVGGFVACRALSQRNDDPKTASRPWDKDRDGFVMGEGAGVLVNYINAHATSTPASDLAEVNAIKQVLKNPSDIKINATKSMIGHCLGAAGGLEAIATVKAITTGWLHPTINQFRLPFPMEDDDDARSESQSQSPPPSPPTHPVSVVAPSSAAATTSHPNGRATVEHVTVAAPPQHTLTLALPIQRPSGGDGGGGGGREDCWSEGATSTLIDAWGERYLELSRGNLKQKHWQEVADAVTSRDGYTKTPKTDVQCKNRIDTLKKKYKIEKSKIGSGAAATSSWPFFSRLDVLLGPNHKPPSTPAVPTPANPSNPHHPSKIPSGVPLRPPIQPQFPQRHRTPHQSNKRGRSPPSVSSRSAGLSADSSDGLPPEPAVNGKRPKREAELEDEEEGLRELTEAILRFGKVYERVESSKLQQATEMEKQRMAFARELEVQRMQFFIKTQMELTQLKSGHLGRRRRRDEAGASGNRRRHNDSSNSNNSHNSG
ncbi:putative 3-oxoacyl-[acyl-carrier-protein] synthase I, chloroplastic [Cocos nucifera]|uniref:beta-ketoacyl-[acyl-carrier-protein] synthase I n=1 Tax=Cocos nucifera TaxID=13894 RepID=A0A8K0I318_COCNU|nr:putative 3-oxoacyl-[acyl-carrier-protein] synthase I, chloroplastic [Cocos nucifera]